MTEADLKQLLDRVQSWPESAQGELVAVMNEIEIELRRSEYDASADELRVIDASVASLDAGEIASEAVVEAAFATFRRR